MKCLTFVALLAIVSPIASQSPCICPSQPPVCVSNGLTYSGECQLNCYLQNNPNVGLYVIHEGPCEGSGGYPGPDSVYPPGYPGPNSVPPGYPGPNSVPPSYPGPNSVPPSYPRPNSVYPPGYPGPNSVYPPGYPGPNSVPPSYPGPNSVYPPVYPGLILNSSPQVAPGKVQNSNYPQATGQAGQNPGYLAGSSLGLTGSKQF